MRKLLYYAVSICLIITATACENEGEFYDLTDRVEASFPSTIVNYQMIPEDGNTIKVELWRGNTNGSVSVPVTVTDNTNGVFTPAKEQFDFADGESIAYLEFAYPDISQFGGEKYAIELEIADEDQVSHGGKRTIKISAQRKLTYVSIGTGSFTSAFFEESWPQDVMKAEEANFYRLPNCYYTGYPIEFLMDNGEVSYGKQPMGYNHPSYGMTSWDPAGVKNENVIGGKTITFAVKFTVSAGSFGEYSEVLEMP